MFKFEITLMSFFHVFIHFGEEVGVFMCSLNIINASFNSTRLRYKMCCNLPFDQCFLLFVFKSS